jgi:hypothetical protein
VVLNDRVLTVSTLGFGRNAGILIVRNLLEDAHRAQEIAPHFQVWRIPLYGLRRKDLFTRRQQCRFKRCGQFWTKEGLRNLCASTNPPQPPLERTLESKLRKASGCTTKHLCRVDQLRQIQQYLRSSRVKGLPYGYDSIGKRDLRGERSVCGSPAETLSALFAPASWRTMHQLPCS